MTDVTRRALCRGAVAGALAASVPARADAPDRLSPAAQREDLDLVCRALDESHVGLHWRVSASAYETRLAALEQEAAAPATLRDFSLRLGTFVAGLGHGHTTLEPPASGASFRLRRLAAGTSAFPLGVRVVDGRLYVAHDLSAEASVGEGAEILSIDGRLAAGLVAACERLLSADGGATGFKPYQLGPGWRFQDLMNAVHGSRERYRVRFRAVGSDRAADAVLPAATPEALAARHLDRRGRSIDAFPPAVAYELRGRTGVLTIGSLYEGLLPPGSAGFEAEFAKAFETIAADGPDRLVLDLRGNEGGGSDYVPMLYAHLADRPFRLADPTILRSAALSTLDRVEQPSDVLRAFSADPFQFVARDPQHGYVLKPEYDQIRYRDHRPARAAYTGPLTVLVDGGSFSATGILLDVIHRFHRREGRPVTFVGETPGVDTRFGWSSGGQSLPLVLPNSGLRLSVPLLGTRDHFGAAPAALPDVRLRPTAVDLRDGVDGVLDRAVAGAS